MTLHDQQREASLDKRRGHRPRIKAGQGTEQGCQPYEVVVDDDAPDTVFVVEAWESADAHWRSLEHPRIQAAIAAARPLLSGEFDGFRFNVVGSPLRDE